MSSHNLAAWKHGHVFDQGSQAAERGTRAVWHAGLLAVGPTSCAGSRSAVCSEREVELLFASSSLHASRDDSTA